MCSYKFSVQAASCVLAVLALPLSVSVLTASAISLQFKNYPNAHVVHDVYPPRGDLAAKEVVEGPLAPATLVKALRRLAQDAPSPYDTDVSAIATSALIPYELLYGVAKRSARARCWQQLLPARRNLLLQKSLDHLPNCRQGHSPQDALPRYLSSMDPQHSLFATICYHLIALPSMLSWCHRHVLV